MEKFLTKENILIAVVVMWVIIQSNYFATKLDLANLKLEVQQYSDFKDEAILKELDAKYDKILVKLDRLK